jgi:hypothetical protein
MYAIVRPDGWNFPLLVHVAGAMLLVGALVVAVVVTASALRRGDDAPVLTRYVVMRGGAEWIASEESVGDPAWVGIGYTTADGGLLLILIATGLAWRAARRSAGGASGSARAVMALSALLIVAYGVAIWAMTSKPA